MSSLFFDSVEKAQLRTLPLALEELFGGKLDEALKQAEEQAHRQCELKGFFKVPQSQTQVTLADATPYVFKALAQHVAQSSQG